MWEKNPSNGPFTHDDIGTSKCGTGTESVLSGLPWVVPVPLCYCHCVSVGTSTNMCGTGTTIFFFCFFFVAVPIYRNFQNSVHLGFHWMLTSFPASYPFQPDLCSRNCVLHSLDTFTLTLESAVLLVITILGSKEQM